jgi:hypothetical protein
VKKGEEREGAADAWGRPGRERKGERRERCAGGEAGADMRGPGCSGRKREGAAQAGGQGELGLVWPTRGKGGGERELGRVERRGE